MMLRFVLLVGGVVVVGVFGISGCGSRANATFCCLSVESCAEFESTPITTCTNSESPYCDDTGQYGPRHTCIPDPLSSPCSIAADCTNPERPYCVDRRCVACEDNGSCSASAPVCDANARSCGPCTSEADCAGRSEAAHCLMTTGACVGCVNSSQCTEATAPICDATTQACRRCSADAECTSNVCDRDAGACVPEANAIYLSPTGQASGSCTRASPCSTFALGLAQVGGARNVVKAAPGTYSGKAVIDGITVTILGDGATLQAAAIDQTVVTVTNAANATINGLTISGATGPATAVGVRCDPASTLRLRRSTVKRSTGGGISINSCEYSLVNNFIVGNGSSSGFGGVQIVSVASPGLHDFAFNSVAGNNGPSGTATGVACGLVSTPLSFTSSIVYDNAVVGGGTQIGGAMCTWTYSDIGQPNTGITNINQDPKFKDINNGDLHVQAGSPVIDRADSAATTRDDIDLDTRPSGAGFDIGADEL